MRYYIENTEKNKAENEEGAGGSGGKGKYREMKRRKCNLMRLK